MARYDYAVRRGGVDQRVTVTSTPQGLVSLQGQSAWRLLVSETLVTSGQPDQLSSSEHHVLLDGSLLQLLATRSDFAQGTRSVSQTIVLSPALPELDFSLAAGSSLTATAAAQLDLAVGGASAGHSGWTSALTLRFVGLDTVEVPAGRFEQACHFEQRLVSNGQVQTSQRWLAAGSGVLLKMTTDGDTQELVSARIGDTALTATAAATTRGRQR